MYKVTRLLHLTDPRDEASTAAVIRDITAAAESARHSLVAPTLPGARNGGDILAHFHFESEAEWTRQRGPIDAATGGPAIRRADCAEYVGGSRAGRRDTPNTPAVYRTLLLRVDDSAPRHELRRFEHAVLQMPEHLPGMRAWQLSPVLHAAGATTWTHVWEQEFTDLDALLGQYMNHPVHWALVDRWFDPECPENIVKDRVCHSFCAASGPVVTDATTLPMAVSYT